MRQELELARVWRGTLLELERLPARRTSRRAEIVVRRLDDGAVLVRAGEATAVVQDGAPLRLASGPFDLQLRLVPPEPRARARLRDRDFRFAKVLTLLLLFAGSAALMSRFEAPPPLSIDDGLARHSSVARLLQPKPPPPTHVAAPAEKPAPKPSGEAPAPRAPRRDATHSPRDAAHVGIVAALDQLGPSSLFSNGPSGQLSAALDGLRAGTGTSASAGAVGLGSRGNGPGGGGGDLGIGAIGGGSRRSGDITLADGPHRHVRIAADPTRIIGSLSREEIERVIKRHESEIRFCYSSALQHRPELAGKLAVTFTIDGSGSVREADAVQDALGDAAVSDCVLARVRRWRFPEPKGGGEVVVTYPWIFAAPGD